MSILRCNSCGNNHGERSSETDKITKCQFCGSEDLSYTLILTDCVEVHENAKGKSNKTPGKKKPIDEFQAGEKNQWH